ncbi:MAG: hypothetical protein AB1416_02345 [Actinomycetota bacterium]
MGAHDWAREARALAGSDPAPQEVPTYGDLTRAALGLVVPLAEEGRWELAASHAARLAEYLADPRAPLDPVGRHAVGALAAAARARDADALHDFAELLDEVFGDAGEGEPPSGAA